MVKRKLFLPLLLAVVSVMLYPVRAATSGNLRQEIFHRGVRSLKVESSVGFMTPPIICLDGDDSVTVNFDVIGEDRDFLRCRLIHCNADWTPSRLLESEYIEGFNEMEVSDYAYSTNTFVHYVNYQITIPDGDFRPKTSGNYILQVYPEDSPDDVWLQAAFYVSECVSEIDGILTTRTDKGFNSSYQQLEISVIPGIKETANPYHDFLLEIVQNNVTQSAHQLTQPLRINGDRVVYAHHPELIFPAGNEYRRFETVRADYPGMHVDSVTRNGRQTMVWLTPDDERAGKEYVFDRTQHGRYKIDEYNSTDPNLSADYLITRFTLDIPEYPGMEIFVDGEFSRSNPPDFGRMVYDRHRGVYMADIPLKQGSYNYRYVMKPENGPSDASMIEGDKYETQNEYLVLLYLRLPGGRTDRLTGWKMIVGPS